MVRGNASAPVASSELWRNCRRLVIVGSGPLKETLRTRLPNAHFSGFLGGVYYPTHVIPSWLHSVSAALPLTYGLRALRRTLLEGWTLAQVLPDLEMLLLFDAVLGMVGVAAFTVALRHARRSGTLAQY